MIANHSDLPLVSVVIPTKNRPESLTNALKAIRGQDYPHYEVVVVDNGSTDNTPDVIAQYGAKHVVNSTFGVSLSRQMGIDSVNGEIIAMCDDDSVPEPDWISQIVRRLTAENDLGLLGGKIIQVGFPEDKGMGRVGQNGMIKFVIDPDEADYFASSNAGIRKSAVDAIGGYDLFFRTGGYEEPDLIFRLKNKGYCVGYEPSAVVRHVNPGVTFRKGHFFYDEQLMRLYFYLKHYRPDSGKKWMLFLCNELKLMSTEMWKIFYQFYDAIRKGELKRWSGLGRRLSNTIITRLSIPWLLWQVKKRCEKEMVG